jgi:hypothetical protein
VSGHFRPNAVQQKPLLARAALLISAPSSSPRSRPSTRRFIEIPRKNVREADSANHIRRSVLRSQGQKAAKRRSYEASMTIPNLPCAAAGSRRGGSRLPIGGRNHFLTLKCRKSGGGWFFLIGIKLPSAPSIYCSLPMNTSLRSSVQLFSVHITVGKRL